MNLTKSLIGAALAGAFTLSSQAVSPPQGVAPVTTPAGGFSINGDVVAGSAGVAAGDWVAGPGGAGVLNAAGAPLNPTTTFHFVDPFNSASDNIFKAGSWDANPTTWQWTTGKANAKTDINNVLMHVATDANLHTWLILAADRANSGGSSYIDFELLQNTLLANTNGTFSSAGPNGGRTTNDLLLTLTFENGGNVANFLAYRWTNSSGGYSYVDATAALPAGKVFVALNSNTVAVPFGAFGQTNYSKLTFVEAAIDMTAMMGDFDPCLSIGVKTIMVKTKSSASAGSGNADFVTPIQYTVLLGPGSYAGTNQTVCSQSSPTTFSLQGQASYGLFPSVSTNWSVVSGSATIDSPTSLNTLAHVSTNATLRLTVQEGNGCTETSDVVLTVVPYPTATISGPNSVVPQASTQFSAPASMSGYAWSVSGNGSISGSTNLQLVTVNAGSTCGSNYNLSLTVFKNGCSSTTSTNVLVSNTGLPTLTVPPNVTLECPANTSTNATGAATAQDNSGNLPVGYSDLVTPTCGGAEVISRAWSTTNICGYVLSAVQTITVQDTTPPTVTLPANVAVSFTANISTNITGVASATDTCSSMTIGYSDSVTTNADGSQIISRAWLATDACGNSASATQTMAVNAPLSLVLPPQSNLSVTDLLTLTVTNSATNPNGTTNALIYQLINPPAGATIDTNGIITWTPTLSQSPSTNLITTVVTTTLANANGSVTISSTNSFLVFVSGPYDGLNMLIDSDGDGNTNLVEVAVGSDPLNPADGNDDIIVYLTQASGNHYLAMQYKARINAAALQLQYLPEVSADKVTWYSDTNNVLGLSVTPADSVFNWVTVRDTTPITPAEARFIHLHVISGAQESFSPIWIGSDTLLQGNNLTLFSQRMIRPIATAGIVTSTNSSSVTDTNAALVAGQFGTNGMPAYLDLNDGTMLDIADTSSNTLALASGAMGRASVGEAYRIRAHFTVASLFGTNNETGLIAGPNPAQADNVLLFIPQTQQTLTLFYYSNSAFTKFQGWVRADTFASDPNEVVYPEQGAMVNRIVASDAHLYLCGPIKLGVGLCPVQPGYNLLGTLKSLSSVTLSNMDLYTGDSTTGMVGNLNPSLADNLIVVQPDGSVTTYFYYYSPGGYHGWINAAGFTDADSVLIPPGSTFFINRQAPGPFIWTNPAE